MIAALLFSAVMSQPLSPAASALGPAPGSPAQELIRKVGIDQRLNEQVPLDLPFRDETGKSVRLGGYFDGKPVVLALVYYECPMLCTLELNGLVQTLRSMGLTPGDGFHIVTVSFNPLETPALASAKKDVYLKQYGRPEAARGWHFLTGSPEPIRRLTEAVGFHYAYDEQRRQYAHASAIFVLTPSGKLARYFYGIQYSPRDLRFALVEASMGRIGTPADRVLLLCYEYDPQTGRYTMTVRNSLRLGALATILGLGALIFFLSRPRRPRRAPVSGGLR